MDRILDKKLKKVLDGRTDSPIMLEALQAVASFYGQQGGNTADARKTLRQDLEKQSLIICDEFLVLFNLLRKRLEALDGTTASLEDHCQSMQNRIQHAEQSMSVFLEKERSIQKQQEELKAKADQVSSFLEKFILTDQELSSLRYDPIERRVSNNEKGGENSFFQALDRVQKVRESCSRLLGSQHQAAGFEMLESLSEHQEAAYLRLHNWILQRCAALERDDEVGVDAEENDVALRLGLQAMRKRPALFLHCQECLMQRRKDVIRRRFLMALTQGMPGSHRPIDVQAYDPVRYLSDILAWVHQALASERELLSNLLGPEVSTKEEEEEEKQKEEEEQQQLSSRQILLGVMEGITALLRARISQLLDDASPQQQQQTSLVLSFRLLSLLCFYETTLSLGEESALSLVLTEARRQSQELLDRRLREFGESVLSTPPSYPLDLSAATFTHEASRQLQDILQAHEASLLLPLEALGYALEEDILTALIEPLLRACRISVEALDPSDSAVYMLNTAAALQWSLMEHQGCTEGWRKRLGEEIQTWLDLLVRYRTESILERSGLGPLLEQAQVAGGGKLKLSQVPGLEESRVRQVMKNFYSSLFALPQFENLQDPHIRAKARKHTSQQIAQAHEVAYSLFSRAESGYQDTRSFLLHTPEQVKLLLDLQEEEEEEESGI